MTEIAAALRKDLVELGLRGLWDGKMLSGFIHQQWGISLGVRQCQRIFRQLGFRLQRPVPKSPTGTLLFRPNLQKLQALRRNRRVDLWAVDEVRFEQRGSRCRMWTPPEVKDPVMFHHPTRKSVGYFRAVRLRDGKLVYSREEGRCNGETFFAFLKRLRRLRTHSGRRVAHIIDNVGYHHAKLHAAWREKSRKRFALEFMPTYSPELNPIERVWKFVRRNAPHNRYFSTLRRAWPPSKPFSTSGGMGVKPCANCAQ